MIAKKVFFLFALLLVSSPVHALTAGSVSSLEGFVDGIMERSIVSGETAGATVAIVQDGRLLMSRGYGFADVARQIPVQSRVTQFRIGSISKVLAWMAVLQQVEAQQLFLDQDINFYLKDFQLPLDFADPITLRHLMTHTPGFEDNLLGLFVSGPRQMGTLGETLAANIPQRVRLPGNLVAYSNYGAALAGYLVTLASGQSWDDYVQAHLFQPLLMGGATTRQPVPKEIDATRAKGYVKGAMGFAEHGFMYVPMAPAGGVTATALDMAKLMVELLNPRGTRVLSAESKAQLLGGAYLNDPLVNGMTLGMYEMTMGGSRAVGHGGNTLLFNSLMVLWPQEKLGVFVSTNTLGAEGVATALVETLARYLGLSQTSSTAANKGTELAPIENGAVYAGSYISARRNHSNRSKILGLIDTVQISFDQDNAALVVADNQGVKRFKRLDQHVMQAVDGAERIVFKVDGGKAQELFFSNRPMLGYNRTELATTPIVSLVLLGFWAAMALAVLFVWPVSALTHRASPAVAGQRLLSVCVFVACLVGFAFFVQCAAVAESALELMLGGFDRVLPLLWLPVAFTGLVFVQVIYLVRVWLNGYWWLSRRLHFVLVVLAQMGLVWWFWYWNLLPPTLLAVVK